MKISEEKRYYILILDNKKKLDSDFNSYIQTPLSIITPNFLIFSFTKIQTCFLTSK